jgi:UDP-galactopyranose mutase
MSQVRPSLVCFSNLDWHYLRYRKQHLMARLARRFDVVYVNPPRASKSRAPREWNTVEQIGASLWVLEPIVLPGVRRSAAIKRVNDRLIVSAIRKLPISHAAPIAWAYSPHARDLVDLVAPRFVVYDIADNYTTPSGAEVRDEDERRELARLAELETSMLGRADMVLCVSDTLAARARQGHPVVHVVPNGCDYEAYQQAGLSVRRHTRPRIGYVGTVAPRVDVDLLVELARANPGWDVQVVGPVSPLVAIDRRRTPPNLLWTGEVPYARVPAIIARFDVGILPLRVIPFATDCSPIQVFDYLAAGKPVVSTPVSQLQAWPGLIRTAEGADAFASAIRGALADTSTASVAERQLFARANSWSARVSRIMDLLGEAGALPAEAAAA